MKAVIQQIRRSGIELPPGLTEAQLAEFQAALGADVPADLASLYADHDGMPSTPKLPMRTLSRAEVLRDTAAMRAYDKRLLEPSAYLFWTDDHSNYAGVFLSGPLADRVFLLDHEEPDPTPRFFNARSFSQHLLAHPEGLVTDDVRDYPATENLGPTAAEDRRLGQDFLREHIAQPEDHRAAFLALALLPPEDTHLVLALLASSDMWIQERTCVLLGVRRHQQAIPQLADVARGGQHNGRVAAILALKRMGTPAADSALDSLERELGANFRPYFRR